MLAIFPVISVPPCNQCAAAWLPHHPCVTLTYMGLNRAFWQATEAIHNPVYFAEHATAHYEELGLKGYWMGYVGSRAAALGTPSADVVTALFHGFSPRLIQRALPEAWRRATPQELITARYNLARSVIAPALDGHDVARAAKSLTNVTKGLNFAGKALAAAHFSTANPLPDDDVAALWHAATVLREYRGDCHVAILTAAGLDGVSSNILAVAAGLVPADQRRLRGWAENQWLTGYEDLVARGWLDEDHKLTAHGKAAREQIEDTTDRVCAAGMSKEATGWALTIEESVVEIARSIVEAGRVQFPNPAGSASPA
jgi:hypothetical protein